MRQLLPEPRSDVDLLEAYRPLDPSSPLLRLDMVASANGAATDEMGRTTGLGGPGDHTIFHALRAMADAILVGAGTARIERYGPHRPSPEHAAARIREGLSEAAPICLVSGSLLLEPESALFSQARTPT